MKKLRVVALALALAFVGATFVAVPQAAHALSGSDFDPGYIISDEQFFEKNALTEREIQDFLNSQVTNCRSGYTCLKDYRMDTFSRGAVEAGHCTAYAGASQELASRIIYKAAQACGINPKVLLVLLEKETSLVTDTWPTSAEYRKAMGYGCPDTSDCDSAFYGFYNQVYNAAKQFRQYTNYPDRRYKIGNVSIQFHPDATCGSTTVNIRNQATANLYNYTPYQPNAAALANMWRTGDSCSSYGNRNFWALYQDWFGQVVPDGSPFGNVEQIQGGIGGVQVSGWAIDPDTAASLDVHIYVDGVGVAVKANLPRKDVGTAHPGAGDAHGFSATIPVTSSGEHSVCVYALNIGRGQTKAFACSTVVAQGGAPIGALDSVTATAGTVQVSGWAIDPDTAGPAQVHVYVDSIGTAITANSSRPDIGSRYPGYGNNHGYSVTLAVAPGEHTVCAYGINVGAASSNTALGCQPLTVIGESTRMPFGNVEEARGVEGGISVSGWAIDPDTASSIPVHIYVDGVGSAYTADKSRPDVGRAHSGYGDKHGYAETLAASPGSHQICVYAINTGPGGHTLLRCSTVVVPGTVGIVEKGRVPIGSLDAVRAVDGGLSVAGWALDPDTAASIAVHIYVDGVGFAAQSNKLRADVGRVYPGYGDNHGFDEQVTVGPGTHEVCVYGINSGPGGPSYLGCSTLTIAGPPGITEQGRTPIGNVEQVSATAEGISVSGWALDPDTASPIAVHVYVDDVGVAFQSDQQRSDVGAAFPGYGENHGFGGTIAANPGSHNVCVYGINSGPGGHVLLKCVPVTVP